MNCIASTKLLHQVDCNSTQCCRKWYIPFLTPRYLDKKKNYKNRKKNGSRSPIPKGKKIIQKKCTQTSQSVHLDGHCACVLFLVSSTVKFQVTLSAYF